MRHSRRARLGRVHTGLSACVAVVATGVPIVAAEFQPPPATAAVTKPLPTVDDVVPAATDAAQTPQQPLRVAGILHPLRRHQGRAAEPCPPVPPPPADCPPLKSPLRPAAPPLSPPAPGMPVPAVPGPTPVAPTAPDTPDANRADAGQPLPAIPSTESLQQGLGPAQRPNVDLNPDTPLPRAQRDREDRYASLNAAPDLMGDGAGPMCSTQRISIGRIMILGQGLTSGTSTSNPAQLNLITDPKYNSVQAIQGANYPFFTLPAQPLGVVPGTPPTVIGQGIPAPDPGPGPLYQSAAQQAFETNPNLPGANGVVGTAVYVPEASGSLPSAPPAANPQDAFLFYDYMVDASLVLPGYAVGFVKLAENMSPLPRDRVYMNYSYFRNANLYGATADVNRFMPGFEKTFLDGWTSVEIRTPFAATLDNSQDIVRSGNAYQLTEYSDIQFGNMSLIFKTLLWEQQTWAITAGVQTMLPTAENTFVNGRTVSAPSGPAFQQIFVANESVHVMPFVGGLWAPNERFFNQILLQVDRDVNGNLAYVNGMQNPALSGRQLQQAGRIFFPTFMYMSFGTGYWVYKDDTANFTGFSPVLELHVNQALEDFQPLCYQGYVLGSNPGVVSVTNALVGCNFEWGQRSTLSFGYVTPIGGGDDRFFDGELRAIYNLRFGRQNRLTRAQF